MTKDPRGSRKPTGKRKPILKKEAVKDLTPKQDGSEVKGGALRRTANCADTGTC